MKTITLIRSLLLCALLVSQHLMLAQPIEQRIKVLVAPDHSDWTYKANEKVKFTISVLKEWDKVSRRR